MTEVPNLSTTTMLLEHISQHIMLFPVLQCDPHQMELLYSILNNSGTVVLANNERLSVPLTLRFVWEVCIVIPTNIFNSSLPGGSGEHFEHQDPLL